MRTMGPAFEFHRPAVRQSLPITSHSPQPKHGHRGDGPAPVTGYRAQKTPPPHRAVIQCDMVPVRARTNPPLRRDAAWCGNRATWPRPLQQVSSKRRRHQASTGLAQPRKRRCAAVRNISAPAPAGCQSGLKPSRYHEKLLLLLCCARLPDDWLEEAIRRIIAWKGLWARQRISARPSKRNFASTARRTANITSRPRMGKQGAQMVGATR